MSAMPIPVLLLALLVEGPPTARSRPPGADRNHAPQIYGQPAFSPDGKYIALIILHPKGKSRPTSTLRVLRIDDWHALSTEPLPGSSLQYEVAWRPDSKGLAALVDQDLWYFQIEGEKWTRIEEGKHNYRPPLRWSRDGRFILLWEYESFGCLVVSADGRALVANRSFPGVPLDDYDWAPDGKSIWIVTAKQGQPKSDEVEYRTDGVYRAFLDGRPMELVWSTNEVRWVITSPNGRYLACVVGGVSTECLRHESAIWVFDTESRKPIQIDSEGAPYPFLSWSPDSTKLAYSKSERCAIWEVNKKRRRYSGVEDGIWIPFFHPTTGHLWGQANATLYEFNDGKWAARHTLAERLRLRATDDPEK